MDGLAVCGSICLETLILYQLRRCLQAIPDRYAIVCVFLLSLSLSVSVSSLSHPVLFDAIDGGSSHLWFNIAGKP
jgi:hypothetical protein